MARSSGVKNHAGWVNPFWFALENNDLRSVKSMLSNGVDINHKFKDPGHSRYGLTPVFIAVNKKSKDLLSLLIAEGCSLEATDGRGETPLFIAVRRKYVSIIKMLLQADANINHVNVKGQNALFLAIRQGHQEIFHLLVSRGCSVDTVDEEGATPLILSTLLYTNQLRAGIHTRRRAPSNTLEFIQEIVPRTTVLDHKMEIRGCALEIAFDAEIAHVAGLPVTKLLLLHGAEVNVQWMLDTGYAQCQFTTFFLQHCNFTLPIKEILQAIYHCSMDFHKRATIDYLEQSEFEFPLFAPLFKEARKWAVTPRSLQDQCLLAVRKAMKGKLLYKIEQLPLPKPLKDSIKFTDKIEI